MKIKGRSEAIQYLKEILESRYRESRGIREWSQIGDRVSIVFMRPNDKRALLTPVDVLDRFKDSFPECFTNYVFETDEHCLYIEGSIRPSRKAVIDRLDEMITTANTLDKYALTVARDCVMNIDEKGFNAEI